MRRSVQTGRGLLNPHAALATRVRCSLYGYAPGPVAFSTTIEEGGRRPRGPKKYLPQAPSPLSHSLTDEYAPKYTDTLYGTVCPYTSGYRILLWPDSSVNRERQLALCPLSTIRVRGYTVHCILAVYGRAGGVAISGRETRKIKRERRREEEEEGGGVGEGEKKVTRLQLEVIQGPVRGGRGGGGGGRGGRNLREELLQTDRRRRRRLLFPAGPQGTSEEGEELREEEAKVTHLQFEVGRR